MMFWGKAVIAGGLLVSAATADVLDLVNPRMGSDGPGNCVVGPQGRPHAAIFPSPHTLKGGMDGYNPAEPFLGFGQLHATGNGWTKYGNLLVGPRTRIDRDPIAAAAAKSGEVVRVGYYAVTLAPHGIRAEATAGRTVAVYRFSYPAEVAAPHVVLNLDWQLPKRVVTFMPGVFRGATFHASEQGRRWQGSATLSGGFGANKPCAVYFAAEFDRTPAAVGTLEQDGDNPADPPVIAWARWEGSQAQTVQLRVAVSLQSEEAAARVLAAEPGDFDALRAGAESAWRETLSRIRVTGGTPEQQRTFYTALYHSQLQPRDRTADAPPGWTGPYWDDHYAVWDTWRTTFPLLLLTDPQAVRDNIAAFCTRLERNGQVRDAFIAGVDMPVNQGGDNVANILADACVKGLDGVEWPRAYRLVARDADAGRGRDYRRLGWNPETGKPMSASYSLEFSVNDAAAAAMAEKLGHSADAERWRARARSGWAALWNPDVESDGFRGFIQPRREDGTWIEVDPRVRHGSFKPYFYEDSAWSYSFSMTHDVPELVARCGGAEIFTRRLRHALETPGLVFDGNEPAFHLPWLFHFAGRPDLVDEWVGRWRDRLSTDAKTGYPNNEDSGAFGAWQVFAALGFYPLAGQDVYLLHRPQFDRAELGLPGGRTLVINRHAAGETADGAARARFVWNGAPLDRFFLRHAELAGGGQLDFYEQAAVSTDGR